MRSFLFTISGLISQAVVITPIGEVGAAEEPSSVSSETEDFGSATRSSYDAVSARDVESAIVENIRGFCAICQSDDMPLTRPIVSTCVHKFCKECYTEYESREARSVRCPVCRDLTSTKEPESLAEDVASADLTRRRQLLAKHLLKFAACNACCVATGLYFFFFLRQDHRNHAELTNMTSALS